MPHKAPKTLCVFDAFLIKWNREIPGFENREKPEYRQENLLELHPHLGCRHRDMKLTQLAT